MNFGSLNPFSGGGGGFPGLPSPPGLPSFGGGGGLPGIPGLPGFPGMGGQQQGAPSGLGGTMQISPYSDPNMSSGIGGNSMDMQGILSMLMQGPQGMGGGQQGYIGGQGLI